MSLKTAIIDGIIRVEGGYCNDAGDSGGETCWGITVAEARANGYDGDMKDLPRSFAEAVYGKKYWDVLCLDDIEELSGPLAAELADTGVNMGVGTAGTMLQRCLNVFNRGGALYPDLKVDGAIGRTTVAALRSFLTARKDGGETVLLRALNGLQAARYIELAEKREKDEAFVFGWIANRVKI